MCDCEELELEDFEALLAAISRKSAATTAQPPSLAPVIQVAAPKRK
jgi:hypothetical protein